MFTMMVIKEEKNWSPILDMDMVKHMVSYSSPLYGGSLILLSAHLFGIPRNYFYYTFLCLFQKWLQDEEEEHDLVWTISGHIYQVENKTLHHIWPSKEAAEQQELNCPDFVLFFVEPLPSSASLYTCQLSHIFTGCFIVTLNSFLSPSLSFCCHS